jgi:cobalamin biosynthesis Mg chelatase CobN
VRDFLLRENSPAAAAIADRLEAARRRGFWHPHRNDIDATLTALRPEPSPHPGRARARPNTTLSGEGREGGGEATR